MQKQKTYEWENTNTDMEIKTDDGVKTEIDTPVV